MLNRVGRVLVGDGANSAATFAGLANMAAGDIAFVGANNVPILAAAATAAANPVIRAVQCIAAGNYRFSLPIVAANVVSASVRAYAAPTLHAQTVQITSVVAGAQYKLTIQVFDENRFQDQRLTKVDFYYTAKTGDTASTIATALRNKILLDKYVGPLVTTSVNTDTITITSRLVPVNSIDKYGYLIFRSFIGLKPTTGTGSGVSDPFTSAGVVTTTAQGTEGTGTAQQVFDMERDFAGYSGYQNFVEFPIPTFPRYSVVGANYDLIVIEHNATGVVGLQREIDYPQTTVLAIPTSSAQRAYVDTVLNAWLGTVGANYAALS